MSNDKIIILKNLRKEFKIFNRKQGLIGSVQNLFSRKYEMVTAVNDVSFEISQGEVIGLLGPNGAGKSTTIKMMTGVLKPTSGEIFVNGNIPYKNREQNSQDIGVVFGQRSQLWWSLPFIESLKLLKSIYMIENKDYKDMIDLYSSIIDIQPLLNKPIRQMSLGQRTLSDILAAFLHNPKIVFLDEPTIGLDVSMKSKIRDLILYLNKERNTTVILTTHDMSDVDALCKRIIIIDKGMRLYDNSIENLKSFFGSYRTLKLIFYNDEHEEVAFDDITLLQQKLLGLFKNQEAFSISQNEEWIDILVNEDDEFSVIDVMNYIQKFKRIKDMKLEEISTESVIKKIYQGEVDE